MTEPWLEVGAIVAAQGVRGEVRVQPLTDFPERLSVPGDRILRRAGSREEPHKLLSGRPLPGKNLFICSFEGITDRNAAEGLVGSTILIPPDARPSLAEGEFWLPDLLNADVYLQETGEQVGMVKDFIRSGQDLLVIQLKTGAEVLIPFVHALVPEVDVAARRVVIQPIPGLLDPQAAEEDA